MGKQRLVKRCVFTTNTTNSSKYLLIQAKSGAWNQALEIIEPFKIELFKIAMAGLKQVPCY
ncbi:hypothetical protein PMIT1306_00741 [Prochlorococcus sp. MIT 1306]|nr:hypothetical protein PMIT1306_00741 [Prochlorococcus sp. MIT 1306]